MLFGVVTIERLIIGCAIVVCFKGYGWFIGDLKVIRSSIWLGL